MGEINGFRAATRSDVSALAALINRAYRGESSRLGWTTEADLLSGLRIDGMGVKAIVDDPDSTLWLSEQDGRIVASLHARHRNGAVHLGLFSVEPALQGAGIGTRLLSFAEAEAKKKWKVRKAVMEVISRRHDLIAYYERHGYHQTGETVAFPTSSLWHPLVSDLEMAVLEKSL